MCVEERGLKGPLRGFYHDSVGKPSKDCKWRSEMICLMTWEHISHLEKRLLGIRKEVKMVVKKLLNNPQKR